MAKAIKNKAPTPIRIPADLLKSLKKIADKENRSLSNLIITILKEYIK